MNREMGWLFSFFAIVRSRRENSPGRENFLPTDLTMAKKEKSQPIILRLDWLCTTVGNTCDLRRRLLRHQTRDLESRDYNNNGKPESQHRRVQYCGCSSEQRNFSLVGQWPKSERATGKKCSPKHWFILSVHTVLENVNTLHFCPAQCTCAGDPHNTRTSPPKCPLRLQAKCTYLQIFVHASPLHI